ncbi:MAG: hypothetical protein FWF60_05540 [Oscillospiraceae bacterium]|nr:hypothetical protein [Oscillospiraceae bacterium]
MLRKKVRRKAIWYACLLALCLCLAAFAGLVRPGTAEKFASIAGSIIIRAAGTAII